MTKLIKKLNKNNKSKNSSNKKSSKRTNKRSKVMHGGDDGRYVLPPSYFGSGKQGYYPDGSSELSNSGRQHAVSQGTIWKNGNYAGPNLYPAMAGGGCGCSGSRKTKRKTKSKSKSSKRK